MALSICNQNIYQTLGIEDEGFDTPLYALPDDESTVINTLPPLTTMTRLDNKVYQDPDSDLQFYYVDVGSGLTGYIPALVVTGGAVEDFITLQTVEALTIQKRLLCEKKSCCGLVGQIYQVIVARTSELNLREAADNTSDIIKPLVPLTLVRRLNNQVYTDPDEPEIQFFYVAVGNSLVGYLNSAIIDPVTGIVTDHRLVRTPAARAAELDFHEILREQKEKCEATCVKKDHCKDEKNKKDHCKKDYCKKDYCKDEKNKKDHCKSGKKDYCKSSKKDHHKKW